MNPTSSTSANQLYIRAMVVLAVVLSLGFTWLVIVAGALRPSLVNMLTQALIVAIIASLLWLVIRRFKRTRQALQVARDNAEKEAALLRKRSAFIYAASDKLSAKLASFEAGLAGLDPQDKNAGPLLAKTDELRTMLHRLEMISKLEANMALTSTTTIDAVTKLATACQAYEKQFSAKGAKLQLAGPKHVLVEGDAEMLHEVFVAIIDNAYKFVPDQTGLLDIVYSTKRHKMYITFTDNGPGIAEGKLAELFKPFSRTDGVMAFNHQGQGLSLYISRLCVELMGGHINLTSQEGSGTTVAIELPLAKGRAKQPR